MYSKNHDHCETQVEEEERINEEDFATLSL